MLFASPVSARVAYIVDAANVGHATGSMADTAALLREAAITVAQQFPRRNGDLPAVLLHMYSGQLAVVAGHAGSCFRRDEGIFGHLCCRSGFWHLGQMEAIARVAGGAVTGSVRVLHIATITSLVGQYLITVDAMHHLQQVARRASPRKPARVEMIHVVTMHTKLHVIRSSAVVAAERAFVLLVTGLAGGVTDNIAAADVARAVGVEECTRAGNSCP